MSTAHLIPARSIGQPLFLAEIAQARCRRERLRRIAGRCANCDRITRLHRRQWRQGRRPLCFLCGSPMTRIFGAFRSHTS